MVLRARARAAYVAVETTFSTDPSPNDGSLYLWVPGANVGLPKNTAAKADTMFFTGRTHPTAPEHVSNGWTLDLEHPFYGLSAAAGDGVAPPSEDFFSRLLRAAFGARLAQTGEGVAAGSLVSNLVLDTAAWTNQNLALVHEAALLSPDRAEVRRLVLSAGSTYNIAGGNWTTAPTTAAIAYGGENYAPDEDGHPSIAVHVRGDITGTGGQKLSRTLLGGGVKSLKITGAIGQAVKVAYSLEGDRDLNETDSVKSALPTVGTGPGYPAVKTTLGHLLINGTAYSYESWELDLGIERVAQGAQDALNGRNSWELTRLKPKLTVNPLYDTGFDTFKDADTDVSVVLKWGSGVLASGRVNAGAIFAPTARVIKADPTDVQANVRSALELDLFDAGILSGSTLQRMFTLARF